MIYSRWRPEGGYDYFETPEQLAIGDDPPPMYVPPSEGGIGTPIQECGYRIPAQSRHVGAGVLPRGLIAPTYGGSLGDAPSAQQIQDTWTQAKWTWAAVGLLMGGALGYDLWVRSKRS